MKHGPLESERSITEVSATQPTANKLCAHSMICLYCIVQGLQEGKEVKVRVEKGDGTCDLDEESIRAPYFASDNKAIRKFASNSRILTFEFTFEPSPALARNRNGRTG